MAVEDIMSGREIGDAKVVEKAAERQDDGSALLSKAAQPRQLTSSNEMEKVMKSQHRSYRNESAGFPRTDQSSSRLERLEKFRLRRQGGEMYT